MSFDIHLKGGFSERKGLKKFSNIVQIDSLDYRTKNFIFNVIVKDLLSDLRKANQENYGDVNLLKGFTEYLYLDVFSGSVESIPNVGSQFGIKTLFQDISEIVKKKDINCNFDFIEAVLIYLKNHANGPNFEYFNHFSYSSYIKKFNCIFINENVMYRIIDGKVTDITNEQEIKEIEQSLNIKEDICTQHLNKAIELLYNKKSHDYENSVKESISAVESMCNKITDGKDSLGDALDKLKNSGVHIHPALKGAFDKLYGYSSNEAGIRHGNGMDINTTFEEAKFMLVTCSAFINYLNAINTK